MNELQVFNSAEFGNIRTINENGKVLFCGKDIAEALGYKDTVNALKAHCKTDGVAIYHLTDKIGREQNTKFITEGNVYRLITHSKLPAAEKFERWVFDEVLPSIRKHGMYAADELLANPELAIKAFTALKEEREKNKLLQADNERMKPKALFADAVSTSKTSILIGDLAKLLKQNGVEIGQRRLFDWLREHGYLMKKGTAYNMPSQRSMEMGLFEIKESTMNNPDGSIRINRTTKVTGKGQVYFVNKFLHGTVNQS